MTAEVKLAFQAHPMTKRGAGFTPSQFDSKAMSSPTHPWPLHSFMSSMVSLKEEKSWDSYPRIQNRKGIRVLVYHIVLLDPGSLLPLKSMFTVEQWLHLVLGVFLALVLETLPFVFSTKKQYSQQTTISKVLMLLVFGKASLSAWLNLVQKKNCWQFSIVHLLNQRFLYQFFKVYKIYTHIINIFISIYYCY